MARRTKNSAAPEPAGQGGAGPGLVVFTPLPPLPTGIADYSAEILPLLAGQYRLTVVIEDNAPDPPPVGGVRVMRLAEYRDQAAAFAAQTHLYMIGNNPDHLYLLPVLARRPGVIVLHDPGLHHLLDCATAALGDIDAYAAALEAEYGAPGRALAEQWRDHELRDERMVYRLPMLRQLLGPARGVIVHSRFAAHKALSHAPHVPVTIAPHPYAPPPSRVSRAAMRARLGIGAAEVVFLSIGFVTHIKRIDLALRALARIAPRLPPFRYVIAGAVRRAEIDVEALAATLGLSRHILVTGFVAEADFSGMIDMADVVINLRHPVGGETSGTLIRALGSGACVVVVDDGPFAEIPDGAAIKLPWGPGFEADLANTLLRLAVIPAARTAIGAAAAAHTARANHPQRTIAAYSAAIDAASASPDRPWRSTHVAGVPPPQARVDAAAPLWHRLNAVPCFLPGDGEAAASVLAVAPDSDIAGLIALSHAPEIADAAWRPAAEVPRGRDLIFLRLDAASPHLRDPDLLAVLSAALRFGGTLVLALSAADPRGHILAARGPGEAALRAHGFRVDLAAGASPPDFFAATPPEPDAMVWRAIKVSDFIARPAIAAA